MGEEQRYFVTVDWCKSGNRGVFCDAEGNSYPKDDEPHTHEEMAEILDLFWLVLSPESTLLTIEQLSEYTYWYPLAEYSNQLGVVLRPCDVPIKEASCPSEVLLTEYHRSHR